MEQHIDLYAVLIAAVLYMIIFVCWYSKWLFGATWAKYSAPSARPKMGWKGAVSNFIIGLVFAYFLAFFDAYLHVTSVGDAMFSSLCLWLGFVLPTHLLAVFWHRISLKGFWIEAGCLLLSLLVMGGIIGA